MYLTPTLAELKQQLRNKMAARRCCATVSLRPTLAHFNLQLILNDINDDSDDVRYLAEPRGHEFCSVHLFFLQKSTKLWRHV